MENSALIRTRCCGAWAVSIAIVVLITVAPSAALASQPGVQWKRQSIKNDTGQRANDLHIVWEGKAYDMTYVRPGQDGEEEVSPSSIETSNDPPSTTAHWEGAKFDWIDNGTSVVIRWAELPDSGSAKIDTEASYWTFNGDQILQEVGFSVGQPPRIDGIDGLLHAAVFENPEEFLIAYIDVAMYIGNNLEQFDSVDFHVPTGEPLPGVPELIVLAPGDAAVFEFPPGPIPDGTYYLVVATAVHSGDPDAAFPVATAVAHDGPRACCFGNDCQMLTWERCLADGGVPGETLSTCTPNPCPSGGNACDGWCGGQSPHGCWCDNTCFEFGDCCDGICQSCPSLCDPGIDPYTCVGLCGGTVPGQCSCEATCHLAGNCCEDVCLACPDFDFCDPGIDPYTCVGVCGGSAPGGCWCDNSCDDLGDCCDDVCDACPDFDFCDPGIDPFVCVGLCGGMAPGGCWCDNLCELFEDCCDDVCEECPDTVFCDPGIDPYTCWGHCGEMAPGGCWCDGACLAMDDCCEDVCEACDDVDFCDPGIDPYVCWGYCGSLAPGGCWCDENCQYFEDCCDGVCDACGDLPGCSECAGDLDDNLVVNVFDLLILLSNWGLCSDDPCQGDLDNNSVVNVFDLLVLLSNWGPCPGGPKLSGTCEGACGGHGLGGVACYCDEACHFFSDCCHDLCDACSGQRSCMPPGGGTCAGACGGIADDGSCWCDEECLYFEDCCMDLCLSCGDELHLPVLLCALPQLPVNVIVGYGGSNENFCIYRVDRIVAGGADGCAQDDIIEGATFCMTCENDDGTRRDDCGLARREEPSRRRFKVHGKNCTFEARLVGEDANDANQCKECPAGASGKWRLRLN